MTDVQTFQPLDTTVIQIRSLFNFMYALGYTADVDAKSGRFVTDVPYAQGNRYISFATAVKLHNAEPAQWLVTQEGIVFPEAVQLATGFSMIGVKLAFASKLVAQVKLCVNKRGELLTMDPMIKALNKEVESFLFTQ